MSELRLVVNGVPRVVPPGATISGLLDDIAETRLGLAVAVNDELVLRRAWGSTQLADGDRVEVLAPARGG